MLTSPMTIVERRSSSESGIGAALGAGEQTVRIGDLDFSDNTVKSAYESKSLFFRKVFNSSL